MSSGGSDRDAHLIAGHDRDVIDRQHVRRIRHRHQQRALVGERHRHSLIALGGRCCSRGWPRSCPQRRRPGRDDRSRSAPRARASAHPGSAPRCRAAHARASCRCRGRSRSRSSTCSRDDQTHVDDHVREKAWRGSPAGRAGDARPLLTGWRRVDLHGQIGLRGALCLDLGSVIDLHRVLRLAVLVGVDAKDRVQVRTGLLRSLAHRVEALSIPQPSPEIRSVGAAKISDRAAHDLKRRLAACPQLEAERPLREQDLQSVERACAVLSRGGEQRCDS